MPIRRIGKALQEVSRIDALIRRKATGPPEEIAKKLNISRSTWFEYLHVLTEELDFPIEYDPQRKTYFYTEEGTFHFGFKKKLRETMVS